MPTLALLTGLTSPPVLTAGTPIYQQLADTITGAIRRGTLPIGTVLPSERLYALAIGVSRTTVTASYQALKSAGLVRGYVGRGAVVVADGGDMRAADAISWPYLASRLAPAATLRTVNAGPAAISLGDGWLHPSLVPSAGLAACAGRAVLSPESYDASSPLLGLPDLQAALRTVMASAWGAVSDDDVLVTGGAQQGLNVIARALVAPGDAVLCETPTWHGALRAFRAVGGELFGVAMDRDGIDPAALEDALIRLRPKLVYLIPSFHCPTGRLMGLDRRRQVLELCRRFRTPIVESHVYGDVGFGKSVPSLKSLDQNDIVIHQGSASKTVSAALRLGWLVAPSGAMGMLAQAKASLDLATPRLPQAILAQFLRSGAYARHLPTMRAGLQARRDALISALAIHCPDLRCGLPQGGLYLWARLPHDLVGREVEAAALAEGLSVRAGEAFLVHDGPSRHIRLCYAAPGVDQIVEGARRLGHAVNRLLNKQKRREPRAALFAAV